jgi:hypothetical protein
LHLLARAKELDIDVEYIDGQTGYYGILNLHRVEILINSTLNKVINDIESAIALKEKSIEDEKKINSSLFMKLKNAQQLHTEFIQAHQRG